MSWLSSWTGTMLAAVSIAAIPISASAVQFETTKFSYPSFYLGQNSTETSLAVPLLTHSPREEAMCLFGEMRHPTSEEAAIFDKVIDELFADADVKVNVFDL